MILDKNGKPYVIDAPKRNAFWRNAASIHDQNYGTNWYADGSDADTSITNDLWEMWILAEEAFANHPIFRAMVNNLVTHTILSGFGFSMDTSSDALNDEIEKHVARWTKRPDAAGRSSLNRLIRTSITNYYLYGESLGLIVGDATSRNRTPYMTKLRGIDPKMLVNPEGDTPNKVSHGIEVNSYGEPVKLWLRGKDGKNISKPFYDGDGNPIVLHMFKQEFFGQNHGRVPITSIYKSLLDLSVFQKAEVKAAANASQINMIAHFKNPNDRAASRPKINEGTTEQPQWRPIIEADAGKMVALLDGEDITQFKLERPTTRYGEFIKEVLQILCADLGYSYEYLFTNWQDSNFSSARVAAIHTQEALKQTQDLLEDTILRPLLDTFIKELIVTDKITTSMDVQEILESYKIIKPKMPLLDPNKELDAIGKKLSFGLTTRQREAERLGEGDYSAIIEQLGRENMEMKINGLTDDTSTKDEGGKPPSEASTRS